MTVRSPHTYCRCIWLVITCTVLSLTTVLYGEPRVSSSKSVGQDQLNVIITGSELPELQSITVTCSYDPQKAAFRDAIISSPLPSTAFSACIDTTESSLTVSVSATSTMTIADGASLIVLRIPLTVSQEGETAFNLTSASLTDTEGEPHTVQVGTTMVARPLPSLSNHRASLFAGNPTRDVFYLLNGRKCSLRKPRAVTGYIIRNSTTAHSRVFIR